MKKIILLLFAVTLLLININSVSADWIDVTSSATASSNHCSSSFSEPTWGCAWNFDQNKVASPETEEWISQLNGDNQWLEWIHFDLGSAKCIGRIELIAPNDGGGVQYNTYVNHTFLEYSSDNSTWFNTTFDETDPIPFAGNGFITGVPTVSGYNHTENITSSVSARYWRLSFTSNHYPDSSSQDNKARMKEVTLYEDSTGSLCGDSTPPTISQINFTSITPQITCPSFPSNCTNTLDQTPSFEITIDESASCRMNVSGTHFGCTGSNVTLTQICTVTSNLTLGNHTPFFNCTDASGNSNTLSATTQTAFQIYKRLLGRTLNNLNAAISALVKIFDLKDDDVPVYNRTSNGTGWYETHVFDASNYSISGYNNTNVSLGTDSEISEVKD